MKVFIIITLAGLAAFAWLWFRKPHLKRNTARTWPAGRGKVGAKLTRRIYKVPVAAPIAGGLGRRP